MTITLRPVILSGGSGTRLWPLSREYYPKQLLAPLGGETLLQATVGRLAGLAAASGDGLRVGAPIVVCSEEHRFLVAEQLRVLGFPETATIILEPEGRNTAPAATVAALEAVAQDPGAILLIMPADHLIQDVTAFNAAVAAGAGPAAAGCIVTFGIVPTGAETGYGYIRKGPPVDDDAAAFLVDRFVEKPDAATAEGYLEGGDYLWNSGIFMVGAATWLEAIERFAPAIHGAGVRAFEGRRRDGDFVRVGREAFIAGPGDSIDYAVMEPLAAGRKAGDGVRAAVIPLEAGWSDLGAWPSIWSASPRDANGNAARGDVALQDTRDSLVLADHRLVATIGLRDIIVVETADAVLVVHKDKAEDVKQLVARLKAEGRGEHRLHRCVHRPWGTYEGIDHGERFQVKRITVNPNSALSLQMHHHRAEHWVVVSGTARVTRGDEVFLLHENESTFIPSGVRHRLENPGMITLEIIEIQSGSYLGEDDIVRFDDHYGRN